MRTASRYVCGLILCLVSLSCGPKPVPPPDNLRLEDPLGSETLDQMADKGTISDFQKAWSDLRAGNVVSAESKLKKIVRQAEWERPGRVALGYIALLRGDRPRAGAVFRDVLEGQPANISAMVGLAQVQEAEGNPEGAHELYVKVLAVEPTHSFAQIRKDITRLEATDKLVRKATDAAAEEKNQEAVGLLERAVSLSPDRAPIYLQLGELYLKLSDYPHAITNLQQAADMDPHEATLRSRLADALYMNENLEQAQALYRDLARENPLNSDYVVRLRLVEDAIKWKSVPKEFREIPSARLLTREALAALIALKIPEAIEESSGEAEIAIDIGGWSREYVVQVTRAGVMDIFPGHMFAPREAVKRGEAAVVSARIIEIFRKKFPGLRSSQHVFPVRDVGPHHVYYAPVQTCLLYGLLRLDEKGDFNPASALSGEEGVRLIDSLTHLIGR